MQEAKSRLSFFTEFIAGRDSIAVALAIGVVFLLNCYQSILHQVNPDAQPFAYPGWLIVILSHIDAIFFAFTTIILMFQSPYKWQKILFCSFEGVMIFLFINQDFLDRIGLEPKLCLGAYMGIFGAFSMYFLGSLAKYHREQIAGNTINKQSSNIESEAEPKKESKPVEKIRKVKAPKGYARVRKHIENGANISEISRIGNIS